MNEVNRLKILQDVIDVSADTGDIELVHRASELRLTVAASCIFVVNAKDAGFVAVKRQRLAVLLRIAARNFKIGEVSNLNLSALQISESGAVCRATSISLMAT